MHLLTRLSLALALLPLAAQSQPLDSLITEAVSAHPATQSAQAQQASARAGLASARWQYWPTPSVLVETAGTSATDSAYQGDHRVATLRLQQPLWTGGRLSAGLSRADAGLAYSQASLDEVRQQLALRVVQAYGDWLAAQLKTASHGKTRAVHEDLQVRVKRRVEQGISAESDLVMTDVRLQSLAADLSVAQLQQDTALVRLGQLLGRPVLGAELSVAAPRAVDPAWLSQLEGVLADGVDLLVDLGGHTSTHRLGVFALRAAPVQATFLGYPHSTGLSAIDWLIGDAVVSPAEHGHLFSEGIAQLPGSVFCWAPVDAYPLPAPREPGAALRLGSFNNAMKLTPRTIALWSRVLHALPGAELLLKAPSLKDAEVQARFAALFAAQGISADRLVFRGPSGLADMMQEYRDIDIALDPTPYNGGTTSLQALWMGVPVVALAGTNFVSRMGASFLHTLGRPDWVAEDDDRYVAAALNLARDIAGLRAGRPALRARMAASALCDVDAYVQAFQALLQRMWVQHCAGGGGRLLGSARRGQAAIPSDVRGATKRTS